MVRPDEASVRRSWNLGQNAGDQPGDMETLAARLREDRIDAVSIQYNFGFMKPAAVDRLTELLQSVGVSVFITLHSTKLDAFWDLVPALRSADLVIVHRQEDLRKLLDNGVERAVIQRQGIAAAPTVPRRLVQAVVQRGAFTIACFGFFLPPKGIHELLRAFEVAAIVNPLLRLKLVNSLYPIPESAAYSSECVRIVHERGLAERTEITTGFLDDVEILKHLQSADLVVLPYTYSTESSSAAIRMPLASMTPVLCSDLPIFDEFETAVHRYPAFDTVALANRLIELSMNEEELKRFEESQAKCVEDLSWKNVAAQFSGLVREHRRRA